MFLLVGFLSLPLAIPRLPFELQPLGLALLQLSGAILLQMRALHLERHRLLRRLRDPAALRRKFGFEALPHFEGLGGLGVPVAALLLGGQAPACLRRGNRAMITGPERVPARGREWGAAEAARVTGRDIVLADALITALLCGPDERSGEPAGHVVAFLVPAPPSGIVPLEHPDDVVLG
jgi:hypothetical protein